MKRKISDEVNNVLIYFVSFYYDYLGLFECIFFFWYFFYKCNILFMYVYVYLKVKKKVGIICKRIYYEMWVSIFFDILFWSYDNC